MKSLYRMASLPGKWLFIALMAFTMQVHAAANQDSAALVTLKVSNAPIEDVFLRIEAQTGFSFTYSTQLIDKKEKVSVDFKREQLGDVLRELLGKRNLRWVIRGAGIVILQDSKPATQIERFSATDSIPKIDVRGVVTDKSGNPIPGATVSLKGQSRGQSTDKLGRFSFSDVMLNTVFVVSSIGYETRQEKFSGQGLVVTVLDTLTTTINAVEVYSTGFQKIPKERATGSFVLIDNELLNRGVGKNVLDRLDGVASGLIFNKNAFPGTNQPDISIRSRGTIFANAKALVVVDDFPYDGDLSNLNPNDIENITILKDAAAASIWGAYSGNGVIVITTKKGKYNQPLRVGFSANLSTGEKTDLFYQPILSSSSYVDLEQFLFQKGQYTASEGSINKVVLSPVVEILRDRRDGRITADEAERRLNEYKANDTRHQMSKYFFQKSIFQQYSVNVSGGSSTHQFFLSAGYDQERSSVVGDRNNRITLNGSNTFSFLKDKLEFNTTLTYTQSTIHNNGYSGLPINWPYSKLADSDGRSLVVPLNFRQSYKDTAGAGMLLDWNYRPLDELRFADKKNLATDIRIATGLKYRIIPGLVVAINYQHSKGGSDARNLQTIESYQTRNYINTFSQINRQTGVVSYGVPVGDILDVTYSNYRAHNVRASANYSKSWNGDNNFVVYAGAEVRDHRSERADNRLYGYDHTTGSSKLVNYLQDYTMYYNNRPGRIVTNSDNIGSTDRYISYFSNASYSFDGRYTITASARKDASNIFGVETNMKGIPLWSAGVSWEMSRERFWSATWLPFLKLRITNGYNGNVDQTLSSYVTATVLTNPNLYNATQYRLINAPNEKLRWEKVNITNLGLDFSIANKALYGSVEYYRKNGNDLIGSAAFDPTSGITSFKGNTADIKGKGLDVILNSDVINRQFKWNINALFSYVSDKVTNYKLKPSTVSNFITTNAAINPIVGNPLYSLYAFEWVGLDPDNGDPIVMFDGKESKDYGKLLASANLDNLKYIGRTTPAYFGSLRNNFSFWKFGLSANIVFKFGYYFRRPTVDYSSLFSGSSKGHPDYDLRWQQPGDELRTNIPSLAYPGSSGRDAAFGNSSKLIEKGDHVRLRDIRVDLYDPFKKGTLLQSCSFYVMVDNIGIIWKKTNSGLDPDFISGYLAPTVYSFGLRTRF